MMVCSTLKEFRKAWKQEYDKLEDIYRTFLAGRGGTVVEIGCGRGQLTFPLARATEECRFICVDSYPDPYSGGKRAFEFALSKSRRLRDRVELIVADGTEWLSRQESRAFDVVMSNEFLVEINSVMMRTLIEECHRVLRPGGLCAHSFLSPMPKNRRQRLLIDANVNPKWAEFPPKEWFSPPPEVVVRQMRMAGFRQVQATGIRTDVTIVASAARSVLSGWHIRPSFWDSHEKELTNEGLEFPDWIIVTGRRR